MAITVPEAQQGATGANVTQLSTGIFATSPSAGDAIVVFVGTEGAGTITHTAPTDSAGNTATAIGSEAKSAGAYQLSAWIFENLATGTGLGSYKVTGHWTSASGSIIAVRVAGQLTPVSYNGDVVQNSLTTLTSSANPSVGPTTVAPAANSIFFGSVGQSSSTTITFTDGTNIAWTHVTGETQSNNNTLDDLYAEHFIESGGSTTKQTAQWSGASTTWFGLVFSLAPAVAGGGVTVAPARMSMGMGC